MTFSDCELDFVISALDDGVLNITFNKHDGSVRKMRCTRNAELIPRDQLSDAESTEYTYTDLVKVFDLDLNEWRSFKPSRLISYR